MSLGEPPGFAPSPFTVLLSIGRPSRGLGTSRSDTTGEVPSDAESIGDLQWYLAVTSVLRATFRRRGKVLVPYDREILPLLWAVALEHADPATAEPGRESDPPLEVAITDELRARWEREIDSDQVGPRGYEATGALRFVSGTASGPDNRWILPEPSVVERGTPVFAIEIWPGADTAADSPMRRRASRHLEILPGRWTRFATEPADEPGGPADDQIDLFVIEKTLDEWLGVDGASDAT